MKSFNTEKMLMDVAIAPSRGAVMQKPLEMSATNVQRVRDVRHTWTGSEMTQAYDERLAGMSQQARNHLYWVARNKQLQAKAHPRTANGRPLSRCSWTNMSVMFTSPVDCSSRHAEDLSSVTSSSSKVLNFCYLCSTMEEHQRNHLKLRVKSAVTEDGSVQEKRQRIRYTAPVPTCVRRKVEEPAATLVQEALYKVTVWTGDLPGASTDAHVYLTITGDQAALMKTRLWRRQGTNAFTFVRGSREVFHVKGPKLGNLQSVTVEHDGLEQRHGWFLERVEVQCLLTKKTWAFLCKTWLSLHHGDASARRDLPAALKERALKEFEVTVETGKKRFAGTDANVFIIMRGVEGSTRRLQLNADHPPGMCFRRGQTDKFKVQVADVGELRSLKIEHDGQGQESSWYLNKVAVRDVLQPQCVSLFICNGWLATGMGDGRPWKELSAFRHLPSNAARAREVLYEVLVKTGDLHGAGTSADVYLVLSGTRGKTRKIFLSDSSTHFERSQAESFQVRGVDVGEVRSIRLGVDTAASGSGWLCDHVKIRKELSRQEISAKLSELKQAWRTAKQQARQQAACSGQEEKDSPVDDSREENNINNDNNNTSDFNKDQVEGTADINTDKKETDASNNHEEKKEGEEEETDVKKDEQKDQTINTVAEEKQNDARDDVLIASNRTGPETPGRSTNKNKKQTKKRDAGGARVFDENGRVLRVPVREEYFFPCRKWFASHHQDALFERELHVEKRTLCYQDREGGGVDGGLDRPPSKQPSISAGPSLGCGLMAARY